MLTQLGPGTVFAQDFRVVRPLSQGGMGAVYVVEQMSTGNQRALKLMHPQLVADTNLRQRFIQEAKIGALIKSDHVVQVVAAGVDVATETPWLAMELLEGSDLARVLEQRGVLPLDQIREIFVQLCHALGAAHAANIVHRDLKPENIFLADSRRAGVPFTVKVLDYGIAKLVADVQTHHTSAMGTPLWMAPEQTESGGRICPATDVWALGLIAFRMLTGRYFWRIANSGEASAMALMREVVFEPMVTASERAAEYGRALPPGFDAWFASCASRQIEARFADATSAFHALDAVLRQPQATGASALSGTVPMSPATATAPSMPMSPPIAAGQTVLAPQDEPWPRHSPGAVGHPAPHEPAGADEALPRTSNRGLLTAAAGVAALLLIGGVIVVTSSNKAPTTSNAPASSSAPEKTATDPTPLPPPKADEPAVTADPSVASSPATAPTSAPASPHPVGIGTTSVDTPTGEATTGVAAGASNVKDADSVIARNRWRFKACYAKALASDPKAGGTVKVAVKVGSEGEVVTASTSSSDAPAGLTQCIVSSFLAMKFSAPEGGSATFVTPVVLSAKK